MNARRHATSLVLITLAIAVAVYAWLWDRGTVTDTERGARATNVLPAFRRGDVTRIEIARAVDGATETIVLERDASEDAASSPWTMTSPRREAASVAAVEGLVQELESATRVRNVEGAAAGLDAPRARVTIAMGKVSYVIALGAPAPRPEGAAYARVDRDAPIVVRAELARKLMADANAYRERTIVPYVAADLGAVAIAGASTIALARGAHGDFEVGGTRASAAALDRIWSAMGELRAERFLDDDEGDRAVAAPAIVVTLTPRDGRARAEIAIGGPCADSSEVVVVRRSPAPHLAACAPRGVVDALSIPASALPDERLFAAHADEMIELRLAAGDRALDLARAGSGWHLRAPADRVLAPDEAESANALVTALAGAEGTLLDRAEGRPRATSRATVVRAERGDEVLEIAAEPAGALVHRLADDAWLRVPTSVARLLEPRAVAVRGRDPWGAIGAPPVTAVSTRCGVAQDLAHDGARWTMSAPRGFAADAAAALDVASAVLHAKADPWVADADDGSFGFADAKCSVAVTVTQDGGARRLALVLGGDARDGVYAHVDGEPFVFVVARAVRAAARRLLVDRSALAIDPATVTGVSLAKRGARLDLVARGGHLRAVDAGASDGGAAKLEDALGAMRADSAIHIGAAARDEGFDAPTLELRVVESDAGAPRRIVFGGVTTIGGEKSYFARIDGVDATFAVPKLLVDAVLAAF